MRRTAFCLTIILLVASVITSPSGARSDRIITVEGHAEIRVVPDEVILTLGIETFHPDLAAAKQENDRRMDSLREITDRHDVLEKHVATDHLSIEPNYENGRRDKALLGYIVRRTIAITLKDVSSFESLLSSALENGVNYVHGVDFRTTELRKHRDRARALAIVAAQEKAEAMASEFGESVGRPETIGEGRTDWWSPYSYWGHRGRGGLTQNIVQSAGPSDSDLDGPTMPGQIAVTARVTVTFALND